MMGLLIGLVKFLTIIIGAADQVIYIATPLILALLILLNVSTLTPTLVILLFIVAFMSTAFRAIKQLMLIRWNNP